MGPEAVGIEVRINGLVYRSLLDHEGTLRLRNARRKQLAIAVPVAIGFTALTVFVARFHVDVDGPIETVAFAECVTVCLAMAYLGLWTILQQLRIRPFVLTPQGFTLTRARVLDALVGRDVFVPIGRLTRVLLDKPRFRTHPHIRLRLEYLDGSGRADALNLDSVDIDDPREVLLLLKGLAPHAMDETVAPFIEPDITKRKKRGKRSFYTTRARPSMMIGLLMFLMVGMMSPMFLLVLEGVAIFIFILVLYGIILAMTYVLYIKVKSELLKLTPAVSLATRTGITLPWMRLAALFVEPRRELPYSEVMCVRDGLDARGWKERPWVRTWHGETFFIRRRTLLQVKDLAGFDFDGFTLSNRISPRDGGTSIFRPNYSLLVPFVTGYLLFPWLMMGLISLSGPLALILIMVPVIGIPFGMFASVFIFAASTRHTRDMTVTPERLQMPRARPKFKEVAASDILEVRAVRGVVAAHFVIETKRGRTKVPLEKAEDLLRSGYPIVDEYGLIGGVLLNMMESPRPPSVAAAIPTQPVDRGALVGMETEKAVKKRKHDSLVGVVLFAFMAVVVVSVICMMALLEDDPMGWALAIPALIFLPLFLVPVTLFVVMRFTIRPQEYYEHGVEIQKMMGKMEFVPWTRFKWVHEWRDDDIQHLMLGGDHESTTIDMSTEGYDRIVEIVKQQLGENAFNDLETSEEEEGEEEEEEEEVEVPSQPRSRLFRFLGDRPVGPRLPLKDVPMEVRLQGAEGGLGLGSMFAVTVVLLLALIIWAPGAQPLLDAPVVELDEGEFVGMNGTFQGEDIRLERPVVVAGGETLSISDARLTVAPMEVPGVAIWVQPGGRLELFNVTIAPVLDGRGFSMELEGSALIEGCNLTYEPVLGRFQTGLRTVRARSDDVAICNSSFWGDLEVALAVVGCAPTIAGCTFGNVSVAAVAVFGGTLELVECRFERCEVGVMGHSGEVSVRRCTFAANRVGMQTWGGNATVEGSLFEDNIQAIEHSRGKLPTMTGNTFMGNNDDLEPTEDPFPTLLVAFLIVIMPLMVYSIVTAAVWTSTRWWRPDPSRKPTAGEPSST